MSKILLVILLLFRGCILKTQDRRVSAPGQKLGLLKNTPDIWGNRLEMGSF